MFTIPCSRNQRRNPVKLFPTGSLNKGAKGPAVFVLQIALKAGGFNPDIIPDGNYGEQTTKGVKNLQCRAGWDETGDFDEKAQVALCDATNGINFANLDDDVLQGPTFNPTLPPDYLDARDSPVKASLIS